MISTVTLRLKERKNGKSYLFLDFHPPIMNQETGRTYRNEYLHMNIYTTPANKDQKKHNERTLLQAEAIRSLRAIEIINKQYQLYDSANEKRDFLEYFRRQALKHDCSWLYSYRHFKIFCNGSCRFGDISVHLCNRFGKYLQEEAKKKDGKPLSHNSASSYFGDFQATVKQAFKERLIPENILDQVDQIKYKNPRREYLTMDEVIKLSKTPCRIAVLKRASMFSILTGLRISDILDLDWRDIRKAPDGGPCIIKNIVKSDREDIIYISDEALEYCGERKNSGPVFHGLDKNMTHYHLKKWISDAGITKDITFHCFRHTYATLQMASGTDIYTISHQLSHKNVQTTQIYADLVDDKRRAAANSIKIKK